MFSSQKASEHFVSPFPSFYSQASFFSKLVLFSFFLFYPPILNSFSSFPSLVFFFTRLILSSSIWLPLSPSLSSCAYLGDVTNDKYTCFVTWPDIGHNKSLFIYLGVLRKIDTNYSWSSRADFWDLSGFSLNKQVFHNYNTVKAHFFFQVKKTLTVARANIPF